MSKQKSLGAFGVTRTTVHRGKAINSPIPDYVDPNANNIPCDYCSMTFKTAQGLSLHKKCKHPSTVTGSEPPRKKQKISNKTPPQASKENKNPSVGSVIIAEARDIMNSIVDKVVGIAAKSEGAKQLKGKKRHKYTAQYKAEAIHACDDPNESQLTVAEKFGVSQSQISRWYSNRQAIQKDAADKLRKLHTKGRKVRKYTDLYPKLWKVFKNARAKGKSFVSLVMDKSKGHTKGTYWFQRFYQSPRCCSFLKEIQYQDPCEAKK